MRIIETDIPDVDFINVDESKLKLAEKIISKIKPLLNEVNSDKIKQIEELSIGVEGNKKIINDSKEKLKKLSDTYSHKKKQKQLLNEILKINPAILFNDKELKHEIIILLKVMNTLDKDKLDYHLIDINKLNRK